LILKQLLKALPEPTVRGLVDMEVGQICCDSRLVTAGDVFVAVRGGQEEDRHQFIADAVGRGACAVVIEEDAECAATRVVVGDSRRALAQLACRFYGEPAGQLTNIGVTGTNGKTTTAFLLHHLLEGVGMPCGYLGTLGFASRSALQKVDNTTPEANHMQRYLRQMVDEGRRVAVLEVSSHGLALQRVEGIDFEVGVFTNLTRDHLDFHASFAAYFSAKARLFESLQSTAFAVVNADDPSSAQLQGRTRAEILTFGRAKESALRLISANTRADGMTMTVSTPRGAMDIETGLTGDFNCYNVLAVLGVGIALGIDSDLLVDGLASMESVPGRFERLVEGQEFSVIVDYAHTPDALERALHSARLLLSGKLICVFGCGGDRDRGKRSQMGKVAGELADVVLVTSDNPRSEEPDDIIDEIIIGTAGASVVEREVDRALAIDQALRIARPGDLVLIAGKGHESEQILADRTVVFDDRAVARAVLRSINGAN
jgi:UDP-N-acetylmuramoyl-L-alanyl-D-glutamate--2,6-diaminopimelate ligase